MRTTSSPLYLTLCLLAACSGSPSSTDATAHAKPFASGGPTPLVTMPVSVTVTPNPDPSTAGQAVSVLVSVSSSTTTPLTGNIALTYGTTTLGSSAATPQPDGTSTATFSVTLPAGTDTVVATYTPSANDDPNIGGNFGSANLTVGYPTTVSGSASSYTVPPGSTVTLYAVVSSNAPGTVLPVTGTVSFHVFNGTEACESAIANGYASCTAVLNGSYSITPVFSGDQRYFGSSGNTFTVDASGTNPTTTVAVSSSDGGTSSYGAAVTFTAHVTSSVQASVPQGSVVFTANGATLPCTPQTDPSGSASCVLGNTTPPLPGGPVTITASYSDPTQTVPDGSGSFIEYVAKSTPTITLTSGKNPANLGDTVTYTAALQGLPSDATGPTGSVEFFTSADGGITYKSLGSSNVQGNVATAMVQYTTTQTATILAVYSGDTVYATVTSTPVAETVGKAAAPTVVLSTSSSSASTGTSVTFTATITPSTYLSGIVPTGTVHFYVSTDGGATSTPLGDGTLGANGNASNVATLPNSFSTAGTYDITAVYAGDTNYPASATSNKVTETIGNSAPTVSLSANPTSSNAGDSVTFTATVTSAASDGTVDFTDDQSNALCTGKTITAGIATCTTTALAAGSRTITATYNDSTHTAMSSLTFTVTGYSTTTTLSSVPSTSSYGTNVVFTANVTSAHIGTPGGTVTITDGTTSSGALTLSGGSITYTVSTLAVGSHSFTATYSGDNVYLPSTSSPYTQTVVKNTTTIALTTSSNPAAPLASVKLTGTVSWTSVTGAPAGTVNFFDGTTNIGSGTLSSGVATFSTTTLAAGPHNLTAQYVGNDNFLSSTSSTLAEDISASAATLSVTASPSPASVGQAITFTGNVSGSLGTTPTGTITITEGSTSVGVITLASGTGTLAASAFPVGTHTFTAVYSGDNVYASTTGSVVLVVAPASTTTTLTSSKNPSVKGDTVTFTVSVSSSVSGIAGSVTLYDGQTPLGTTTLSNGTATFAISSLTVGSHTIQAQYAGNTTYAASVSAALMQVVDATSTTTGGGTDGGTTSGTDAGTTTKKSGGGCDVATGSASGALSALFLLAVVALLRRRSVA